MKEVCAGKRCCFHGLSFVSTRLLGFEITKSRSPHSFFASFFPRWPPQDVMGTPLSTPASKPQRMHLSEPLPFPTFTDPAPGGMSVADLPLQELYGVNTTLKHFVELTSFTTSSEPPTNRSIEAATKRQVEPEGHPSAILPQNR